MNFDVVLWLQCVFFPDFITYAIGGWTKSERLELISVVGSCQKKSSKRKFGIRVAWSKAKMRQKTAQEMRDEWHRLCTLVSCFLFTWLLCTACLL